MTVHPVDSAEHFAKVAGLIVCPLNNGTWSKNQNPGNGDKRNTF